MSVGFEPTSWKVPAPVRVDVEVQPLGAVRVPWEKGPAGVPLESDRMLPSTVRFPALLTPPTQFAAPVANVSELGVPAKPPAAGTSPQWAATAVRAEYMPRRSDWPLAARAPACSLCDSRRSVSAT